MDKAYKGDIPRHKKTLAELRREFSRIPASTDWVRLRIDPLLRYVTALERLLQSPQFAGECARLRRGVAMFHADLLYLRTNIKALKDILAAETKGTARASKPARPIRKASRPASITATDPADTSPAPSTP